MKNEIVKSSQNEFQAIKDLVINALTSQNSKIMYAKALDDFLQWRDAKGSPLFTKALVNEYRAHLQATTKYAPSTINLRLSAIRKLAKEAADNGIMDPNLANGIANVEGIKTKGVRTGNWLTKDQAQKMINAPDITTLKGLRDRAILAIMIGGGLRRSEVASLTFDKIQQRDARWVISDMVGKGNRVRTVPIPVWAKVAIDEWAEAANLQDGHVFRWVNRGGSLAGDGMTPQAIADTVKHYADKCNIEKLAAHDLRRTFAKLAKKANAPIDQIQLTLGHASIATTERYLGTTQDLISAPCDTIDLHLRY